MTDLPLAPSSGCGCGTCGCGAADDTPVLDVRAIPAAVRHAAVHGALDSLPLAGSIVLLAPHRPLPLLAELDERRPGAFAVTYDVEGPDTWAVRLTRTA
ncbi:MAG: DUF2249 domain-containing protein [Actinobacteria bacterium]|jgi:uncharacterized protein (DUF2249 family)|nr:DUF2249 domain-containing protein [Actinomycetota bacterium]